GIVTDTSACPTDWLMFERWAGDLKHATLARRELVQREMELRLLRMAMDGASSSSAEVKKKTPGKKQNQQAMPLKHDGTSSTPSQGFDLVQQMASYMAAHYTESIRLQDITAQVPRHPNYAMTL